MNHKLGSSTKSHPESAHRTRSMLRHAVQVWRRAEAEAARQVALHCAERGAVVARAFARRDELLQVCRPNTLWHLVLHTVTTEWLLGASIGSTLLCSEHSIDGFRERSCLQCLYIVRGKCLCCTQEQQLMSLVAEHAAPHCDYFASCCAACRNVSRPWMPSRPALWQVPPRLLLQKLPMPLTSMIRVGCRYALLAHLMRICNAIACHDNKCCAPGICNSW